MEESTRSRREEDKSETGSGRERNRETEGGERDKETKTKSMVALFSISLFYLAKFTFCFGLILIFGIHSANIFVHLFSFICLVIQISVYRQRNHYSDRVNWKTR